MGGTQLGRIIATLLFALATDAHAESGSSDEGDRLFEDGRAAAEAGDCRHAIELLEKSMTYKKLRNAELTIALCEINLGLVLSAARRLDALEHMFPDNSERARDVRQARAKLAHLPRLRVELADGAPSTRITLDGAPLGDSDLGVDMRVHPGLHVVVASSPGRADRTYEMNLEAGRQATLVVQPGALNAVAQAARPSPSTAPARRAPGQGAPPSVLKAAPGLRLRQVTGWTLGSLGAVTVATGVGMAIASGELYKQLRSVCPNPSSCPNQEVAQGARRHAQLGWDLARGSLVAIVYGATTMVSGGYLVLSDAGTRAAPAREASVAASVGPRDVWLGIRGSF